MGASKLVLHSPERTARILGTSPRTLERWRVEGTGPRFCRIGRRIAYRESDIEAWIGQNVWASTSEAKANALKRSEYPSQVAGEARLEHVKTALNSALHKEREADDADVEPYG